MSDPSHLPVRPSLDRAAMERVLRRAAELQADAAEPGEALTEDELLEVGKEVGLAPQHLRQALAEERTHVEIPPAAGLTGRLFGARGVSAARTVPGTPQSVLAALDAWMQREECLQVKRRFADRVSWEPQRDFFGNVKRRFNIGGRGYYLTRANEVAATVVAVDDARVLVRLDADMADALGARARLSGAAIGGGLVAGAALVGAGAMVGALMAPVIAVAALPALVGLGGGLEIARHWRATPPPVPRRPRAAVALLFGRRVHRHRYQRQHTRSDRRRRRRGRGPHGQRDRPGRRA